MAHERQEELPETIRLSGVSLIMNYELRIMN